MKSPTYVLLFAAMGIVPTIVLWGVSPTDSVRVWYPTLLSYVGEHLVASAGTLLFVCIAFRIARLRMPIGEDGIGDVLSTRPGKVVLLALLYFAVDLSATLEIALLQTADQGTLRLWHTRKLADYLVLREPVYAMFALALWNGVVLRLRARRAQAS